MFSMMCIDLLLYFSFLYIFRIRKSNVSYKSLSHLPNESEVKELKLFVGELTPVHIESF